MSPLEQALTDYLRLRHSLGHELAEAAWLLPGFVAYLDAHGCPTVTVEAALVWAQQTPKSPTGRASTVGPRRMTAVRGFARYLSGIDASTQVPPLGLMPHRARWRRPFIYSPTDIDAVLNQARQSIGSPLRAATYETLIGLLAASGLRIGEAIKLDRTDVDWDQGVLLIRESKFGKSRLVPCTRAAWRLLSVTPSCIPPVGGKLLRVRQTHTAALCRRAADVPPAHHHRRDRRRRTLATSTARSAAYLRSEHPARLVSRR